MTDKQRLVHLFIEYLQIEKNYSALTISGYTEAIEEFVRFMYDLQSSGNLLKTNKLTLSAITTKPKKLRAAMEITKPSLSK